MTAYIITDDGLGYVHHGRYTSEDGAIRGLLKRVKGCFEIRSMGTSRKPVEITAAWLMESCREVQMF